MSNPTLQEDLDYLKEIRRRHADADRDFIQYVLDPERVHLDRKILLRIVDSLSATEPAGDALRQRIEALADKWEAGDKQSEHGRFRCADEVRERAGKPHAEDKDHG